MKLPNNGRHIITITNLTDEHIQELIQAQCTVYEGWIVKIAPHHVSKLGSKAKIRAVIEEFVLKSQGNNYIITGFKQIDDTEVILDD